MLLFQEFFKTYIFMVIKILFLKFKFFYIFKFSSTLFKSKYKLVIYD